MLGLMAAVFRTATFTDQETEYEKEKRLHSAEQRETQAEVAALRRRFSGVRA